MASSLPGLMRAQKCIRREWQANGESHTKEEMARLLEAAASALKAPQAGEAQLGEALETLCALAHVMDLDAETALRSAVTRRIERLRKLEEDRKACK